MFWGQKHPISDEQLSAYADGRVAPTERTRVEEHLELCEPCRDALGELRALNEALSAMPKAARPRSFVLRAADVEAQGPAAAGTFAGVMPMLSGVTMAAFVAFAVLVGVDMSGEGASHDSASSGGFAQAPVDADAPAPQGLEEAGTVADGEDGASREPDAPYDDALPQNAPPGESVVPSSADEFASLTATAKVTTAVSYNYLSRPSATIVPSETPAMETEASDDGDSNTALRAAQIATAALGLVAGGSVATIWWRRRA